MGCGAGNWTQVLSVPKHLAMSPAPGVSFLGRRKTQTPSVTFLAPNMSSFSMGTLVCTSFLKNHFPFVLLENQLAYNSKHNKWLQPHYFSYYFRLQSKFKTSPDLYKITCVSLLHKNGLSHSNIVVKLYYKSTIDSKEMDDNVLAYVIRTLQKLPCHYG